MAWPNLYERVREGDRRALGKAITLLESASVSEGLEENPAIPVIGITGPPGVGKSTLINALVTEIRRRDLSVGIIAVDPTSPITGGALLGDRIRMQGHVGDPNVFVRSMATRGQLGGLSESAAPVIDLMTQAGFDVVLVETVGVGQSEVEIMHLADPVVLVLAPGWGDQIQADKAGVIEIADLIVVNKADRPGVDSLIRALKEVSPKGAADAIAVTVATEGTGVSELVDTLLGDQPD